MRVRLVGLVALLALVVASCGGGVPEASGPSEWIQVHGDWTIDIYNEDGSLDQHVQFSNALTNGGETLARMLGREIKPKVWLVLLDPRPATDPESAGSPCLNNGAESSCVANEGNGTVTMQVIEGDNPGLLDTVKLDATVTADKDGEIFTVSTSLLACTYSDTNPASSCANVLFAGAGDFTGKDLVDPNTGDPAPVSINAGQIVQVQILFSFTSG